MIANAPVDDEEFFAAAWAHDPYQFLPLEQRPSAAERAQLEVDHAAREAEYRLSIGAWADAVIEYQHSLVLPEDYQQPF